VTKISSREVPCAWCKKPTLVLGDGPSANGYAIERGDGDKFYCCSLNCALWLLSDWESDGWLEARPLEAREDEETDLGLGG